MAVTVTSAAAATTTAASIISSGAFTCSAGSILVVLGYYYGGSALTWGTPVGFTLAKQTAFVSAIDGKTYGAGIWYKVATGAETSAAVGFGSGTADYLGVAVWEIAGIATAQLIDSDSSSGSASPLRHPAMDAGEAAIRFAYFRGSGNASQIDTPTFFTASTPDTVTSNIAIRSSYRITTNAIGVFDDTFTVGGWLSLGLVVGSAPAAAGAAGVMFGADW